MEMRPRHELLLATNNAHKLREYRSLLRGLDLVILSPAELGLELDVPENAPTYAENAKAKALAFARASGRLALADDSGLEVVGLGGEPGVRSSRYAGAEASDRHRISLVLQRLQGRSAADRSARFVCVIAVATPDGQVFTVEGECRGSIAEACRGEFGFGYDPIFFVPEQGKTMAELPPAVKNRISHRAQAARRARPLLRRLTASRA